MSEGAKRYPVLSATLMLYYVCHFFRAIRPTANNTISEPTIATTNEGKLNPVTPTPKNICPRYPPTTAPIIPMTIEPIIPPLALGTIKLATEPAINPKIIQYIISIIISPVNV